MYKALTAAKSKCPPTKSKRPNFGPPQNGCRRPSTSASCHRTGGTGQGGARDGGRERQSEREWEEGGRERQRTEIDRRQSQSQREREREREKQTDRPRERKNSNSKMLFYAYV